MEDALINKNAKIKDAVTHLMSKFGSQNILIKDHWSDDNLAIGITDKLEKYLVYISTHGASDNTYYAALENPPPDNSLPYEPAGDFDNVRLEDLELLVKKHLNL